MKNPSSSEIDISDVRDRIIKNRQALGYLADHVEDEQLCANLMLIEESMEVAESMLSMFIEKGIEEETAIHEEAAFE